MCVYSMVADDWSRRHRDILQPVITPGITEFKLVTDETATKADIEELRKELRELRKLLKAAAEYDAATGQPDCEQEEKIALIRKLAELTGVNMEDCLPKPPEVKETVGTRLTRTLEDALRQPVPCNTGSISTGPPAYSNNVSWATSAGSVSAQSQGEHPFEGRKPWATRDDGSHT